MSQTVRTEMDSAVRGRPPSSQLRAYVTSAIFFAAAVFLFKGLIDAFKFQSLSDAFTSVRASPWGLTAVADYIVGAVFNFMFIWLRKPPSMLCLNYIAIAVVFPFVGNFLLLLYMSYVVYVLKNVELTFTPVSFAPVREPIYERPANKLQTRGMVVIFTLLLMFFLDICLWAFHKQSISDGLKDFGRNQWVLLSFEDNLGGLLLTFAYVVVREEGVWSVVIPWFLGFALFGNVATCIYALKIAYESDRKDISFTSLFLSTSKRH